MQYWFHSCSMLCNGPTPHHEVFCYTSPGALIPATELCEMLMLIGFPCPTLFQHFESIATTAFLQAWQLQNIFAGLARLGKASEHPRPSNRQLYRMQITHTGNNTNNNKQDQAVLLLLLLLLAAAPTGTFSCCCSGCCCACCCGFPLLLLPAAAAAGGARPGTG